MPSWLRFRPGPLALDRSANLAHRLQTSMSMVRSKALVVILAGIAAILAVPPLISRSPSSTASLAKGTDAAFATSGLEPRENQIGGGALRWLRPKATFQFDSVGPGFVDIDLVVRGHRTEVTLTANGAILGTLLPGQGHFTSRVRLGGAALVFGMEAEGFAASGRTLGTQFVSLEVTPGATPGAGIATVPTRLWLALGAVFLVGLLTQALSGLSIGTALLPPALLLLMVIPAGLWRSRWLFECALLLAIATLISGFVSRRALGSVSARGWLQAALLIALTIHGVLPPSPLVIQSDVQLHGNKLGEVAKGNLFPTSRTDHQPPFEIPYGFSFYGLLAPWASSGTSNVAVVREGAAFFSALSVLALALVLGRSSAVLAAASVLLWTFAPVNLRTMVFGNLSNVFAQAIFVLFLAGAVVLRPGLVRAGLLTLLVAVSATAHLSSFIVLLTLLLMALALARSRSSPAFKPLLAGVLLASCYFATFLPLILAQVPRLLGERGGSAGIFDPWRLPNLVILGAGWPLLALVALSVVSGRVRTVLPLAAGLAVTALTLALAALVSPVEVRYMLAVLPLLAIVGASTFDESSSAPFPRQSLTSIVDLPWLRTLVSEPVMLPLAWLLLLAAVVNGVSVLLEFLPLAGV